MRITDVPSFLRGGLFYQNLDQEDEDAFEVPENCTKNDTIVESLEDLKSLLRTVQFWGLDDIPLEVIEFMLRNGEATDFADLSDEFQELSKILQVKIAPICDAIGTAIKLELGIEVVRRMVQLKYPATSEACEAAATIGDLEILMYLHTEGCPWDERTTRAAVLHNHCDCLRYALAQRCPVNSGLLNVAATAGSVEGLQCLSSFGFPSDESTILAAISGHNLNNVRYLVDKGCAIAPEACTLAAFMGDLACLTFLHERGQELTILSARGAAVNGHLPCLVYLHTQGCAWDMHCCAKAAFGGHLDCLKYMHENGCVWNYQTATAAMMGGSWSCLWYVTRHGGNVFVPVLMLVCIAMLIFSIFATFTKDRSKHDCNSLYSSDMLFIYNSTNCVLMVLHNFCNDYYTEYISKSARDIFRICFLLFGAVLSVYCLYSLYTCKDDTK